MAKFAIRVPSLDDLLDPYSVEPLERRPLREDVRERILYAWIDTREERPSHLTVQLPADGGGQGLDRRLEAAIRHDLQATAAESRRLRAFTRGERLEALIALAFMIVSLVASSFLDAIADGDALLEGLSQGLLVLGWVALWSPAERIVRTVSRRLFHRRYRELSQVPIEVTRV